MLWDIFCRVIDNFGDIGVCWRLSADLAARGHTVRLWVDDASALRWMAPGALEGQRRGIQVLAWAQSQSAQALQSMPCADVWIEAFGCDIPDAFVAHYARAIASLGVEAGPISARAKPAWINLEYLSAEPYVERSHGLPSPVLQGPAKGWTKHFFYPGFGTKTGGLLREQTLAAAWQPPDAAARAQFFSRIGVQWQSERVLSLFCYEPPVLKAVLEHLAGLPEPLLLLVTPGRASNAVRALLGTETTWDRLQISHLPTLTQTDYDGLLTHCDLNFVRGEDSVLRALWAGRPFIWHIYPQDDQAHAPKLEAFLETLHFSAAVCRLHRAWNGLLATPPDTHTLQPLNASAGEEWQAQVLAARQQLFKLPDLSTSLLQFVQKKR